jgi:hypothetical protein
VAHSSDPIARKALWLSVSPGLAIFLTVIGFNLLGDGLRDLLDPRMSQQVKRPPVQIRLPFGRNQEDNSSSKLTERRTHVQS